MLHTAPPDAVTHRLVFTTHLGWPLVAALTVVVLAVTLRVSQRTWGRPWGPMLVALRLAWVACAFVLALLPEWLTERVYVPKPHVALLVDDTRSMGISLGDGPPRSTAAKDFARDALAPQPDGQHSRTVSVHTLTGTTQTDLLAGLERLVADAEGAATRPDAIVLVSDGADNTLPGGALTAQATAALQALGVPVSTLTVATAPHPWMDVAIASVSHDPFGFIKNTQTVDVTLTLEGDVARAASGPLILTLRQDDTVVATTTVIPDAPQKTARLAFVPKSVGTFAYGLEVSAVPKEATLANNHFAFVARVVRDKIRVLHVAGRPSWDQRFLRETLKAKSQVDLVSFYILRTPYSDNLVPESELSLIPFPVERLFTGELQNFDVVVFQNFDCRPFRMEGYLPNLARAVEDGLGLMMVGGADSFGQAGYGGTALEAVLPTLAGGAELWPGPVRFRATAAGEAHPLMSLCRGAGASHACHEELPVLTRINPLGAVHKDATVLAVAGSSDPSNPAAHSPLLVSREVGKGRTLALGTDTLWHWRVHDGPLSAAARAYEHFWHQALLWLTHDPETLPLQVVPTKLNHLPETPFDVALTLAQQGSERGPVAAEVFLEPLAQKLQLTDGGPLCRVTFDASGQAVCQVPGLKEGAYRLRARAQIALGQTALEGSAVVVVQDHSAEAIALASNSELMARISQATGGRVLRPNQGPVQVQSVPVAKAKEGIILGRHRTPLWDNGVVLAVLGGLFTAEVLLRRRLGLR